MQVSREEGVWGSEGADWDTHNDGGSTTQGEGDAQPGPAQGMGQSCSQLIQGAQGGGRDNSVLSINTL